jgi:hypothetical protein
MIVLASMDPNIHSAAVVIVKSVNPIDDLNVGRDIPSVIGEF